MPNADGFWGFAFPAETSDETILSFFHPVTGEMTHDEYDHQYFMNYLDNEVALEGKSEDNAILGTFGNLIKMKVAGAKALYSNDDIGLEVYEIQSPMRIKLVRIQEGDKGEKLRRFVEDTKVVECSTYPHDVFSRKIAIAGAPSSGKTETARTLTSHLNIEYGCTAEHATEYARSFILRYGIPDWRLQPFLEAGMARRENDLRGHHIMISDGPRFLSTIYTSLYFNDELTDQSIYILHKIYKKSLQALTEYTDIVLCMPQKLKEDGTRFQTENEIFMIHAQVTNMLKGFNVPYIEHDVKKTSVVDLAKKIFKINVI